MDKFLSSPRFSAPIPTFYIGGLWVNPQTADIKSGYRGRESRTSSCPNPTQFSHL